MWGNMSHEFQSPPFLAVGCCYASSSSWLKTVPTYSYAVRNVPAGVSVLGHNPGKSNLLPTARSISSSCVACPQSKTLASGLFVLLTNKGVFSGVLSSSNLAFTPVSSESPRKGVLRFVSSDDVPSPQSPGVIKPLTSVCSWGPDSNVVSAPASSAAALQGEAGRFLTVCPAAFLVLGM